MKPMKNSLERIEIDVHREDISQASNIVNISNHRIDDNNVTNNGGMGRIDTNSHHMNDDDEDSYHFSILRSSQNVEKTGT